MDQTQDKPDWRTLRDEIIAQRDAKIPAALKIPQSVLENLPKDVTNIPRECGLLSAQELELTETLDAVAARDLIAEGKLAAVDVVTAFAKRAAIVHQLTNCLTDFFMDEALVRAKELDEYFAKTGKTVGPLHGLPISVKNYLDLAGHSSDPGVLAWANSPPKTESHKLIQVLYEAGAVFYCKTTVPQSVMHLCSGSFWGYTLNPYNTGLTSGGSSSGEAVLIAMKGSLGNGSDGGGSIRNPAANCGVYGFKPTAGLLPRKGSTVTMPGNDLDFVSPGPIAYSPRDIELYIYTVMDAEPWRRDVSLAPLKLDKPWSPSGRKWRIGWMKDDRIVRPHPPILRGMDEMLKILQARDDVELVEYVPWEHQRAQDILFKLFYPDGGRRLRDVAALSGEPYLPLTEWSTNQGIDYSDMHEFWALVQERDKYRDQFYKHFESFGMDVLLSPVGPGVAEVLGEARYWGYTCQWNLVNYPGAVFPTGLFADKNIDTGADAVRSSFSGYALSDQDATHQARYNPEKYHGAPISLQIVGGRWQDAKVLGALRFMSSLTRQA